MEMERINPVMIGSLRATSILKPFLIKKSERKPENNTPQNAAINGNEAKSPDFIKLMWR